MMIDDIKCPFYIADKKKAIRCQGFVSGVTTTHHFDSVENKEYHLECFCKKSVSKELCPHYVAVGRYKK